MNSQTLKEAGFSDFLSLKELQFTNLPSNQNSVLVLADCTLTGKPTSDILYIGKSKKPVKRVFGGYLAGYGGKTTRKIHSKIMADGKLDKIIIGWMVNDKPKTAQKDLLEKFKKEHGQYPVWNAQKKPLVDSKKALKIVKTAQTHKSAKTSNKLPVV